jgi:hypothetical protein
LRRSAALLAAPATGWSTTPTTASRRSCATPCPGAEDETSVCDDLDNVDVETAAEFARATERALPRLRAGG